MIVQSNKIGLTVNTSVTNNLFSTIDNFPQEGVTIKYDLPLPEDLLTFLDANRTFKNNTEDDKERIGVNDLRAPVRYSSVSKIVLIEKQDSLLVIHEEQYLRQASLFDQFKYYVGYNELSLIKSLMMKFINGRFLNNLSDLDEGAGERIARQIMLQRFSISEKLNALPWYSRIPMKILSDGYVNQRVRDFSHFMGEMNRRRVDLGHLTIRTARFNLFVMPYGSAFSGTGVSISNRHLLEFNSLKGRAICCINAFYFSAKMVLSLPFVAAALVAGVVVTAIFTALACLKFFGDLLIQRKCEIQTIFKPALYYFGGASQSLKLPLLLAATVCRSAAAAIFDPQILLTVPEAEYDGYQAVSMPSWLLAGGRDAPLSSSISHNLHPEDVL